MFSKMTGKISPGEYKNICDNAIKIWHFEKTTGGVKPVEGEYDPTNPNHVPKNKVIKINLGLIQK
jgi:hypothetical protein